MTKPNLAVVPQAPSLADMVQSYCNRNPDEKVPLSELARESGVSVFAIRQIAAGKKARHQSVRKLREFLLSKQAGPAPSLDGLDPSSRTLANMVVGLAKQHDRLDGLHQYSFRHYVEEGGPEYAVSEAVRMMNLMLTSTNSLERRMNLLLELHEIVKHPK